MIMELALGSGIALLKRNRTRIGKEYWAALENPPEYEVHGELVSVIVPALDEKEYLEQLFTSLQNNNYRNYEVVVCDSSVDEAAAETQELCMANGVKYVWLEKGNVSAARNLAVENSTGDVVMFVDADCVIGQRYIEQMMEGLTSGFKLVHGSDPQYGDDIYSIMTALTSMSFKPEMYTARGMVMRKDDFWAIGGFDEGCNPAHEGFCREDLKLGKDTVAHFGEGSLLRIKDAVILTSNRRSLKGGIISDSGAGWGVPVRGLK